MSALMPTCVYTPNPRVMYMYISVLPYLIHRFVCLCPHPTRVHTCTLPSLHLSAAVLTTHKCGSVYEYKANVKPGPCVFALTVSLSLTRHGKRQPRI